MAEDLKVDCMLKDCAYFRRHEDDPSGAYCAHPDKKYYMNNATCPLYKTGWNPQKQADLVQRFFKRS